MLLSNTVNHFLLLSKELFLWLCSVRCFNEYISVQEFSHVYSWRYFFRRVGRGLWSRIFVLGFFSSCHSHVWLWIVFYCQFSFASPFVLLFTSWWQWWTLKSSRHSPLKKWLNSLSKLQMFKGYVIANRGWKSNCHFLQNVSKQSSVSHAHLSPHTYTAYAEWCGIGHWVNGGKESQ